MHRNDDVLSKDSESTYEKKEDMIERKVGCISQGS